MGHGLNMNGGYMCVVACLPITVIADNVNSTTLPFDAITPSDNLSCDRNIPFVEQTCRPLCKIIMLISHSGEYMANCIQQFAMITK